MHELTGSHVCGCLLLSSAEVMVCTDDSADEYFELGQGGPPGAGGVLPHEICHVFIIAIRLEWAYYGFEMVTYISFISLAAST